jgi:ribosomal protein L7/L12
VLEALRRGNTIEAIKLLRASGNFGLKEAKALLEAFQRSQAAQDRIEPKPGQAALKPNQAHRQPGQPDVKSRGTVPPTVADALKQGNKLEAIRRLREQTGMGLKEAKDAVELQAHVHQGTPGGLSPGQVPDSPRALWWTVALLAVAAAFLAYFLMRR